MAEQAAAETDGAGGEAEFGEQIGDDVVVVAGVERDLGGASALGNGAGNVDGLVAVERRDLDRAHGGDFAEGAPEFVREQPAADRGLKVESAERDLFADGAAMGEQLVVGGVGQGG